MEYFYSDGFKKREIKDGSIIITTAKYEDIRNLSDEDFNALREYLSQKIIALIEGNKGKIIAYAYFLKKIELDQLYFSLGDMASNIYELEYKADLTSDVRELDSMVRDLDNLTGIWFGRSPELALCNELDRLTLLEAKKTGSKYSESLHKVFTEYHNNWKKKVEKDEWEN